VEGPSIWQVPCFQRGPWVESRPLLGILGRLGGVDNVSGGELILSCHLGWGGEPGGGGENRHDTTAFYIIDHIMVIYTF
jgi:hypothetical protein